MALLFFGWTIHEGISYILLSDCGQNKRIGRTFCSRLWNWFLLISSMSKNDFFFFFFKWPLFFKINPWVTKLLERPVCLRKACFLLRMWTVPLCSSSFPSRLLFWATLLFVLCYAVWWTHFFKFLPLFAFHLCSYTHPYLSCSQYFSVQKQWNSKTQIQFYLYCGVA